MPRLRRWFLRTALISAVLLGAAAAAGAETAPQTEAHPDAIYEVTVNSKPPGARIFLNGRDTGFVTPHTITGLKPGAYKFRVKYPRRKDATREIELYPGGPSRVTVDLYPAMLVVDFLRLIFPLLLRAALMTILLTVIAVSDGLIIGIFGGMGRISHNPILRWISGFYVDFVRGTPLLVQIMMVYYALPPVLGAAVFNLFGLGDGSPINIPPFPAAILALSVNSGAYVTEIVRAGIQSIDKGQTEAARSLGLSHRQAMRHIILPQAMRRVIPPLGNEFIAMLKDSSLVSVIAMEELVRRGQIINTTYYRPIETWLAVAVVFLLLTLPFTRLVAYFERRLKTVD